MDMNKVDPVRDTLMKENETFRHLVHTHEKYEKRLSELAKLSYPNEEEQEEESVLKKKKLAVKDELYSIMSEYSRAHQISH